MDTDTEPTAGRDVGGQLIGTIISAAFGALWAVSCAITTARFDKTGGIGVGIVGVLLGAALVVAAIRLRAARAHRGGPGRPNAMFGSRGYRIIVAVEVVAIVASGPVFGGLGMGDFVVFWVAFVVGAHFLGFGRLFWRGYYLIAVVMLLGVAAGLITAVTVSPTAGAVVVTAVCAVDLLAAATIALVDARSHG